MNTLNSAPRTLRLRPIAALLGLAFLPQPLLAQTVRNVATEAQLRAAIEASAPGDIVNLTSDIVVGAELVRRST